MIPNGGPRVWRNWWEKKEAFLKWLKTSDGKDRIKSSPSIKKEIKMSVKFIEA